MPRRKQHDGQIGDMWLTQRGGIWYRTWYDSKSRNTRRATLGTEDREEAELRLAEWVVLNCELRDEQPRDVPLAVVLDRYYEHHARDTRSGEAAKYAISKLKNFYGETTVDELTLERQAQFVRHLREQECSDGYIQRILTVAKAALRRARRNHDIVSFPEIEMVTSNAERERILTMPELATLLDAAPDHIAMYIMIACNTLARPEAVLQLKRSQVDFENQLIRLNPPGRRQTKKYRPTVPITRTLLPWLQMPGRSPYFVHWHVNQMKPIGRIRTSWNKLRARAGLSSDVVPYTLRHTMATELRKRDVPPWEVAGMLGHKSSGITERYAKYAPDYLGHASTAIDEYFEELQKQTTRRIVHNVVLLRTSCAPAPDENYA